MLMSKFFPHRLIPLGFVTEVLYPPREIPHAQLLELFNRLSGPHRFLNLKLLPEGRGATFAGEQGNRCEILRDKTVIREDASIVSFENYCETSLAILREIAGKIAPPVFVGQLNAIRMLYPLSSEQAANQFLIRSFLKLPEGLAQELGRPLAGIGLRLVFPPLQQMPNEYQLRIEPFFRDQTQIFVENAGRFFPPFKELEEARGRLQATYDFLKSSLAALFGDGS